MTETETTAPQRRLSLATLVVDDYDRAIAFYCGALGFALRSDTRLSDEKRWVVVAPGPEGAGLLLARGAAAAQRARIGDQTGGRVAFFLETDDMARDRAAFEAAGVVFEEATRRETYGQVAVFRDPFGNRWDLIQPAGTAT